ncbi:BatD family protein [Reichenbachiella sp. MALMAid0571]|uniref:BatD family protein n=1 Tax=Reichenbachiella sp. MALMAid0571 TaxID=3143939 RepID=UPI0032DEDDB0
MLLNRCLLFFVVLLSAFYVHAQQLKVELGEGEIAINEPFTITFTVENATLKDYSGFPEIEGLVKRGTSSSSSTNFINGQRSFSQSITQNYVATAEGEYELKPFSIKVNGQLVKINGKKIKVGPAKQRRRTYDPFGNDPFQDVFGRRNAPQEFVDVEADAFLALTTDKSSVYLGEGFTVTIAFYVSAKNRAELSFHELGTQLPEIVKKIKPNSCWEENFEIGNITGEAVEINGQRYSQFKIYQATYYPLNTETIEFPSIDLEMIKYKVAKNPSFFGRNRQENIEKFSSKPKTVVIKELPPHPLKESVSVGNYKLQEKISSTNLQTGESFSYSFNISGEGNISSINEPNFRSDENFDFYPPNVRQDINKGNGKIRGGKSFSFYGIPNEPGTFNMKDYFSWIYFNPTKEQYDTLKSEQVIIVSGESKKNESISSTDMGSFYDSIELKDNTLFSLNSEGMFKTIANIAIFLMLAIAAFVVFKK